MTLPVSSPSSHSQFDDVGTVQGPFPTGQGSLPPPHEVKSVQAEEVEKRLDDMARYRVYGATAVGSIHVYTVEPNYNANFGIQGFNLCYKSNSPFLSQNGLKMKTNRLLVKFLLTLKSISNLRYKRTSLIMEDIVIKVPLHILSVLVSWKICFKHLNGSPCREYGRLL